MPLRRRRCPEHARAVFIEQPAYQNEGEKQRGVVLDGGFVRSRFVVCSWLRMSIEPNRELALLSHAINMAREWGLTDKQNPC